jgi:hypothetical protein
VNLELEAKRLENEAARAEAQHIVYLMAVLATLFGVIYLLGLAGKLIVDGTVHSASSPSVQMASAVVGILLDLALLIMFVGLRWQVSGASAIFAELAAVFMILVCVTSTTNWFVQLAIVPRLAGSGDASLLALLDVHNETSAMYAVEHLGWGVFYGLATILMGIAIRGGRLENWISWLLLAGGTLSLVHVVGIVIAKQAISDLGFLAWGLLLPATTLLLAVRYKGS